MVRKGTRQKEFAPHLEQLEQRQVMSADPLAGFVGGIEHHDVVDSSPHEIPPLGHHLVNDPDFWVDLDNVPTFEDYFDQVEQNLIQAHQQTGWFNVQSNYGFTGMGQTVAVIDSGIAYDHFALGGGLGAGYRVVGGWDFTEENDANPYDDGPNGGHGTHVSGIIGSSSSTHSGVAPGVDLVSLRVFNDAGAGYFSWVENALRWVHENRNSFANPITAINLSLGVSSWNAATVPTWANLEDEFAQLEADGIFIAVSAGNSYANYNQPGLSYPAASQYVVPVMSTDDAGSLSYFSQRLSRAIAAPGRSITSTVPDYSGNRNGVADDYGTMSGTSMAAPYVAGASTLVREAMQFVGMSDITQDMIYDHLMATADSVLDGATNMFFKRLNLSAAIDALMPTDDYGSNLGSAYQLGTLSGSASVSGIISTLNDQDYFTFTASSSGIASFETVALRERMTPSWQAYNASGQTIAAANGAELAFDVVAGQTYSVRLSSTGGLGHYDFDVSLASAFSFTDWGSVDFNAVNDVNVAGEQWYRVQASAAGYLTVQGAFDASAGSVGLAVYDANFQLLANGSNQGGLVRTDVLAAAGDEFFVRLSGAHADVDITLLNLVSHAGSVVTAVGTAGDDAFAFSAAAGNTLTVNGVSYHFAAGSADQFHIDGGAGVDSIVLTGSAAADDARLRFGRAVLSGAGYAATATGFENATVYGGGGADVAVVFDSAGDDAYFTYADRVMMTSSIGTLSAWHFAQTSALTTTGDDVAYNFDSAGNDVYRTFSHRTIMIGAGFSNETFGFDRTFGYASQGADRIYSFDSAGDDAYRTYHDRVIMSGTGYSNYAQGFDATYGYSSTGVDTVHSYDSAGDDMYRAWSDRVVMSGAGYSNYAQNFDHTYAYATTGNDSAYSYDSAGDDMLRAYADRASFTGAGYSNYLQSFDRYYFYATTGFDRAYIYDSPGDDMYRAWSNRAVMTGDGYYIYAQNFENIYAYSSSGNDSAYLYDSPGDDLYRSWSNRAVMSGVGYYNYAQNFRNIYAYSTSGADEAYMYDSAGDDLYRAWDNRVVMSGAGYYNYAQGFKRTVAFNSTGNDHAVLYDSPFDDLLTVRTWGAALAGGAYSNEVRGFGRVSAHSVNGGSDAIDSESVDYLFAKIGAWA